MTVPDETRVLLVKPGDLLLIGNLGQAIGPEMALRAREVFTDLGLKVVFFHADIDIAKLEAT